MRDPLINNYMHTKFTGTFHPPLVVIESAETDTPGKCDVKITMDGFDRENTIKLLESAIAILQKELESEHDEVS